MAEAASEPVEPIAHPKTCVLKASIHCEGCKRKVKKILSQIQGVEFVDVDTKQQKVTVIGNVETEALVKKLVKAGKQAQPWPEKKQSEKAPKMKEKSETKTKSVQIQTNEEKKQKEEEKGNSISDSAHTEPEPKPQPKPNPQLAGESGNSAGKNDGKSGEVKESKEEKKGGEDAPVKESGEVAEKKQESAERSSTGGNTAEQSGVGVSGKKKKNKGQNRNSGASELQSPGVGAPVPARARPEKKVEKETPTNHSPPRQQYYPAQHHDGYYSMPAPPVYGMSYNTAHPSNYTASYYAAPPQPYSYAYAYPGSSETEPPPPQSYGYGNEPRPSQTLDSFEMFSDENPNGCIVS